MFNTNGTGNEQRALPETNGRSIVKYKKVTWGQLTSFDPNVTSSKCEDILIYILNNKLCK